jgi:hypothetical protein
MILANIHRSLTPSVETRGVANPDRARLQASLINGEEKEVGKEMVSRRQAQRSILSKKAALPISFRTTSP